MNVAKDLLEDLELAGDRPHFDALVLAQRLKERREEERVAAAEQSMQDQKRKAEAAAAAAAAATAAKAQTRAPRAARAKKLEDRGELAASWKALMSRIGAANGKAKSDKKDKKKTADVKAKDVERAARLEYRTPVRASVTSEKSPDLRDRIVVVHMPTGANLFEVYLAIQVLEPASVYGCYYSRSTVRFEFFDHLAARRVVDLIVSQGLRAGDKLVKNARVEKAEAERRDTDFPWHVLSFSASPSSAARRHCRAVAAMRELLASHGLRPGIIAWIDPDAFGSEPLTINFMSCREAQAVSELLARVQPDIGVTPLLGNLAPVSPSPGASEEVRTERDVRPGRDAGSKDTHLPAKILLSIVIVLVMIVMQETPQGNDARAKIEAESFPWLERVQRPFPAQRLADLEKKRKEQEEERS